MDAIHKSDEVVYVSHVINVKEFLSEWLQLLTESKAFEIGDCSSTTVDDTIAKVMQISPETVQELQIICGGDKLKYPDESKDRDNLEEVPPNMELVSLGIQLQELKNRKSNPMHKQMFLQRLKHKNLDWNLVHQYRSKTPAPGDEIKMPEVLITIRVHRPFRSQRPYCTKSQIFLNLDQEFEVLGCQLLTELRDKISCKADMVINCENIESIGGSVQDIGLSAKDIYPSGFFYVNGVFYNDMRHPKAKDYSKVIIDWSKNSNRNIGPFTSQKMEKTTFGDLTLRLGQPYVYQHQGSCEHLLIFTDLRLLDSDDCQDRTEYPLYKNLSRQRRVHCMICDVTTAKWITYGNSRMPYDPSFFCETCFKTFNYNENEEKLGIFEAHRYSDRHAAL